MALIASAGMIRAAYENGYAVPHFNICNLETILAVADAAVEHQSPVIFGIHPVESAYAGRRNLVSILETVIEERGLTAAIHLDHSPSLEEVLKSLRAGFTSVMFDGSTLPLEENVRITELVVQAAHGMDVSVEAEVGTIGKTAEYGGEIENPHLADPAACARMAATGIDFLAVAIGNAHGVYIEEPRLDFVRLQAIRDVAEVPLVLHGGSGIPADQVQTAIGLGIAKFNVGTALHVAFRDGMAEAMSAGPESHDIMGILSVAQAHVREVVGNYIGIAMSAGRAN